MSIRIPDTYGFVGRDNDDQVPVVPFVPFRCPRCGRHKPDTYRVEGRIRYHRCQHCRTRYKSLEVPADQVRDFKSEPPLP